MTLDQHYLNTYRDARIIVTGGAGAIGNTLCRKLTELGATVTVIDDLSSAAFDGRTLAELPSCSLIPKSILDPDALTQAFSQTPQVVFHLAALFANQNSVEHPERDLMINGLGTLRVLQAAQTARA